MASTWFVSLLALLFGLVVRNGAIFYIFPMGGEKEEAGISADALRMRCLLKREELKYVHI